MIAGKHWAAVKISIIPENMSEFAFTPEPWVVVEDDTAPYGISIEQDGNVHDDPSLIADIMLEGVGIDREVGLANARLVAAAPKLLRTLIAVSKDSICMRGFHEQFRHQIRSSIAEAVGDEQPEKSDHKATPTARFTDHCATCQYPEKCELFGKCQHPAKIPKGFCLNFETLQRAAGDGRLALISALRVTGEQVYLVAAIDGDNRVVPFAEMIDGNPYELYQDPTT